MSITSEYPPPMFTYGAYGVEVDGFGEDGGYVARGHVPDLRFVAACNHMARTILGLRNVFDDPLLTLDDVLPAVSRVWAVSTDPVPDGYDWAVRYGGITEDTPGAFPITVLDP